MLVEVDDELARRLERVAPARSRRRSEFIRRAILKALGAEVLVTVSMAHELRFRVHYPRVKRE